MLNPAFIRKPMPLLMAAMSGENLTDKETRVWNNDVPLTDSNSYFGVPERPRSIAIQARYRF